MAILNCTHQDSIPWRIMTARKQANLSQSQLAAQLFVSQPVISDWERGVYEPRLSQAKAIAIATGKSIEFLCP